MNNKKEIKRLAPIVKKINTLRDHYQSMSDEDLKNETVRLKDLKNTMSDDKILPSAFALVREASRRALNKEHYEVQLMSGITLYNGRISEAKTGEGKTITIYLPAYLEALNGQGVHVVTVNDYLANRDATEAKKVFDMLGISVGCVLHQSTNEERKEAYACDITYVTNSELGFDYLKDNIVMTKEKQVLRGFNYAIIDEVDSILIDEAKTPLIISKPGPDAEQFLTMVDHFVKTLQEGKLVEVTNAQKLMGETNKESGDYVKNEKERQIYLTEYGIKTVEKAFGIKEYGNVDNLMLQKAINNALRANYMMKKDKDYIVRDGKIEIVDLFTGRVLPGRQFSDGLHQALEAKENVEIRRENITVATVTYQSFFNKYKKKAGLTGTAMTSAKEFKDVYHLDVVEIPTNRPVIREDKNDLVFRTKEEKWDAVLKEVIETHEHGQPILIGTSSINDSEIVSDILDKNGIEHATLNAKNEALEAEIIAQAGQYGAVTVATNMAGRGTDIILDDRAKDTGGLKVIGTERHDSRRIDNQLKGRSGRQGDPGSSQFFISLEDKLLRVFGEQGSMQMLMMMATTPGEPLEYGPMTKIVEKAQQAVETENRLVRENMLKYDLANNEHREQIYEQRNDILTSDNLHDDMLDMFNDVSDDLVMKFIPDTKNNKDWDMNGLIGAYFDSFPLAMGDPNHEPIQITLDIENKSRDELMKEFQSLNAQILNAKEQIFGDPIMINKSEKFTMLIFLDQQWCEFLSAMEYVKQNIGNQAYAQRDPSLEYKKKGVELFNRMIDNVKLDVIRNFLSCSVKPSNGIDKEEE